MGFSKHVFTLCSTLFLALTFSSVSFSDWSLQQPSSIHFLTNKNIHATEVHHFKQFDATIKDSGLATLTIDLASVDTRIAIRDERMQKHLFETSRFNQARFEADIPATIIEQVRTGKPTSFELEGIISLHGERALANTEVMISTNQDKTITVHSITPLLINAESFNLVEGINKLAEIAGLKSITYTVPVTFSLTFKAD